MSDFQNGNNCVKRWNPRWRHMEAVAPDAPLSPYADVVMATDYITLLREVEGLRQLRTDMSGIVAELRETADEHDRLSTLASPTYTGSRLRRIADALEGKNE